MKHALSWLAPGGVVVLLSVIAARFAADNGGLAHLGSVYAYAVLLAAALLAWRFHRSRVVAAVVAIAVAVRVMLHEPGPDSPTVYAATTLLLPITLAMLAAMRDRGVVTLRGLSQLGFVLAQPLVVSLLLEFQPEATAGFFGTDRLASGSTGWSFGAVLPVYAGSFAIAVAAALLRKSPVEKGFVWALVSCSLAAGALPSSPVVTFYLASAGLVLGLSVVEISYSMAYRDELTGLPARRALPEALDSLGSHYSIAMVDVDHFKKFNDRHGHDVGDQVLRMVASLLKGVSGGGRSFRYGGEEFTVVFPGKSRDDVLPHLEELCDEIESYRFTVRGRGRPRKKPVSGGRNKTRGRRKLRVTVSIGVAERSERFPTAEQVLKAADKALYRAKRAGRNRVSK
jgi:diguanylate cyclase (GGDEF)-like protein